MIAVDHLLSDGRGSQPVTVTVCRTCEAADPDFNRLRSAGGLPFYYGIHRGRRWRTSRNCGTSSTGSAATYGPGRALTWGRSMPPANSGTSGSWPGATSAGTADATRRSGRATCAPSAGRRRGWRSWKDGARREAGRDRGGDG